MDPEGLGISFWGLTAITFQEETTLITQAGPFKMEGARWHLLSKVFSSPVDIKPDLEKKCCLLESKWKIKYDLLRN